MQFPGFGFSGERIGLIAPSYSVLNDEQKAASGILPHDRTQQMQSARTRCTTVKMMIQQR